MAKCKYCSFDVNYITKTKTNINIKKTIELEYAADIGMMFNDSGDECTLDSTVYLDGVIVSYVSKKINYCPMCGRKVKEDK